MKSRALFAACCLAGFIGVGVEPEVTLLPRAHAHNDYEHARPLLDALAQGFASVEADVWLVEGRLLVAHDREHTRPERTLEALYLDPLRERVARNGGRVFRGGPGFTLMIDFKSEATNTYAALRTRLRDYEPMLTRFHAGRTETNAVTIVISGNRPRDWMLAEPVRLAGYDGRLSDLDAGLSPHFAPWISDQWKRVSTWTGVGVFPEADRMRLRTLAARARQQGQRLRLWGAPDTPAAWRELQEAGVDLINTDDLAGFRRFATAK